MHSAIVRFDQALRVVTGVASAAGAFMPGGFGSSLASRVVTMPEYLERRYGPIVRQFFAIMTLISNVVAFLAPITAESLVMLASLCDEAKIETVELF